MVIRIIGLPDRSCHQRSGSLKTHSQQTAGRTSCPIPEETPERVQFEKSSFSTRADSFEQSQGAFQTCMTLTLPTYVKADLTTNGECQAEVRKLLLEDLHKRFPHIVNLHIIHVADSD
jgi:hypothetical protein